MVVGVRKEDWPILEILSCSSSSRIFDWGVRDLITGVPVRGDQATELDRTRHDGQRQGAVVIA